MTSEAQTQAMSLLLPISFSGTSDLSPTYIYLSCFNPSQHPHSRSLTISVNRKLILSQLKPVQCQMPAPALSATQAAVTSQESIHPFAMSLLLRYSASSDLTGTLKGHTPSPALSAIQPRVTSQVRSTCPSHVSPSAYQLLRHQ